MATTQQILQAIDNMQANIQESLPVIPNNGNPGGAHNMPVGIEPAPPAAQLDPYAWAEPSPDMDTTRKILDEQWNKFVKEQLNRDLSEGRYRYVFPEGQDGGVQMLTNEGFTEHPLYGPLPILPQHTPEREIPQYTPPVMP